MVLYVEKQESLYSVLNKVSEADGEALELVIPEFSLFSKSGSNFKILHAEVKKQKKNLVVITTDKTAIYLAEKAEISVSKTPSKDAKNWKKKLEIVNRYKEEEETEESSQEESPAENNENEEGEELKEDELTIHEGEIVETVEKDSQEGPIVATSTEEPKEVSQEKTKEIEAEDVVVLGKEKKQKQGKSRSFSKLAGIFVGVAVLFLVGLGGFSYFLLPKATVQIILAGKDLSAEEEIQVEVGAIDVNQELQIIPGTITTVEETGEKSMPATGTKEVGEKATGEITIQNFETTDTIFPAGTVFAVYQGQEGEDLEFLANSGVTVEAATETFEDDAEGNPQKIITPSSATVAVTAADKGTDYNLSAGTTFIVGTELYTSYRGENNAAFTGGSSKEVSIVDQADITNVLNQLSAELETKAENDLRSKLVGDQKMINKTIVHTVLSQTYDKNVGDEADEVKLSLKIESRVTFYSESQIKQIVMGELNDLATDEYTIREEDVVIEPELVEAEDNGNLLFKAKASATTYPVLNESDLRDVLRGIKPQEAEAYLKGLDKVLGYNISVWPPLPQIIQRLPFVDSRLEIETTIQSD